MNLSNNSIIRFAAISGNILYILWITYNGISEGGKDVHLVQAVALSGLVILLLLNTIIIKSPKRDIALREKENK